MILHDPQTAGLIKAVRDTGFGLTVAEAMWKRRPVVGSRIGGIQDQIVDGESGLLVSDPRDLTTFGAAVAGLLNDPDRARSIGAAAHERVREQFLAPRHLARYFELIQKLVADREGATASESASAGSRSHAAASPTYN